MTYICMRLFVPVDRNINRDKIPENIKKWQQGELFDYI